MWNIDRKIFQEIKDWIKNMSQGLPYEKAWIIQWQKILLQMLKFEEWLKKWRKECKFLKFWKQMMTEIVQDNHHFDSRLKERMNSKQKFRNIPLNHFIRTCQASEENIEEFSEIHIKLTPRVLEILNLLNQLTTSLQWMS